MVDKVIVLPAGTTSWTVPIDWNNTDNTIGTLAAGGSGSVSSAFTYGGSAGGGAYSEIYNLSLTIGNSITVSVPTGPAGIVSTGGTTPGIDGGDCYFNGASYGASSCAAKGGKGGNGNGSGGVQALGGAAASGIGTTKYSGGQAPAGVGGVTPMPGAGGAAGPHGNGVDGTLGSNVSPSGSYPYNAGPGGAGDNGSGGAGGLGNGTSGSHLSSSDGVNGTQWTPTSTGIPTGPGGGGGAAYVSAGGQTAGTGGLGGGGGGSVSDGFHVNTSGTGGSGAIYIRYRPILRSSFFLAM